MEDPDKKDMIKIAWKFSICDGSEYFSISPILPFLSTYAKNKTNEMPGWGLCNINNIQETFQCQSTKQIQSSNPD